MWEKIASLWELSRGRSWVVHNRKKLEGKFKYSFQFNDYVFLDSLPFNAAQGTGKSLQVKPISPFEKKMNFKELSRSWLY